MCTAMTCVMVGAGGSTMTDFDDVRPPGRAAAPVRRRNDGDDPLLVGFGYVSAFEGGLVRPERAFIAGYLRGIVDRDPSGDRRRPTAQ